MDQCILDRSNDIIHYSLYNIDRQNNWNHINTTRRHPYGRFLCTLCSDPQWDRYIHCKDCDTHHHKRNSRLHYSILCGTYKLQFHYGRRLEHIHSNPRHRVQSMLYMLKHSYQSNLDRDLLHNWWHKYNLLHLRYFRYILDNRLQLVRDIYDIEWNIHQPK